LGAARIDAAPEGVVVIGSMTCFRFRVPDGNKTIQQRVDHRDPLLCPADP
jgi:hypothetical protein